VEDTQIIAPVMGGPAVANAPGPLGGSGGSVAIAIAADGQQNVRQPGFAEQAVFVPGTGYVQPGYAQAGYAQAGYAQPTYVTTAYAGQTYPEPGYTLPAGYQYDAYPADAEAAQPLPRRHPVLLVSSILGALTLLSLAGWFGYRWTQSQYFVDQADGQIAIFQGIPQNLGPLTLHHSVEVMDANVADLPRHFADSLPIRADSLADARQRAVSLLATLPTEPEQPASPTATVTAPAPTPTPPAPADAPTGNEGGGEHN
jgi:PPM family protein phosphatase